MVKTLTTMLYDRNEIQEYPFDGEFYTTGVDSSLSPLEQEDSIVTVLKTKCDIDGTSHTVMNNFISASFAVFIPIDKNTPLKVKNGMRFKADMYGMSIDGKVVGVFPSQLGACTIYIQETEN